MMGYASLKLVKDTEGSTTKNILRWDVFCFYVFSLISLTVKLLSKFFISYKIY